MKPIQYSIALLLFICVFLSCQSPSKAYINGACRYKERTSPFAIKIKNHEINNDTLLLDLEITNVSDSTELIMKGPYTSITILNDSSLSRGRVSAIRCYDCGLVFSFQNNKSLINCNNCFQYYSNSPSYVGLKKGESYTLHEKHQIIGLKSKPKGYKFLINYSLNIPEHISKHCPNIWSGSLAVQSEITK